MDEEDNLLYVEATRATMHPHPHSHTRNSSRQVSTGRGGAGNLIRSPSRGVDPEVQPGLERGRETKRDQSIDRVRRSRLDRQRGSYPADPFGPRWGWKHPLTIPRSRPDLRSSRGCPASPSCCRGEGPPEQCEFLDGPRRRRQYLEEQVEVSISCS